MNTGWRQLDAYCWERNGYRVAMVRVREEVKYIACTPALSNEDYERRLQVRYELGMPVPQRREFLGCYREQALAFQACADHERRAA